MSESPTTYKSLEFRRLLYNFICFNFCKDTSIKLDKIYNCQDNKSLSTASKFEYTFSVIHSIGIAEKLVKLFVLIIDIFEIFCGYNLELNETTL